MPMNSSMPASPAAQPDDLASSGDSPNGSDFGFTDDKFIVDDEDDDDDTLYDDEEEGDSEFSGSGDGGRYRETLFGVVFICTVNRKVGVKYVVL